MLRMRTVTTARSSMATRDGVAVRTTSRCSPCRRTRTSAIAVSARSSMPTRVTSCWPSRMPDATSTTPAAGEGCAAGGEGASELAHGAQRVGAGTRTRWSRSPTTSAVVRRAIWVSPVGISRWASTGTATCCTSSGSTWSRPASAAWAREARSRCSVARGEAPEPQGRARPGRVGEVDDVLPHRRRGVHLADRLDHRRHRGGVGDRPGGPRAATRRRGPRACRARSGPTGSPSRSAP